MMRDYVGEALARAKHTGANGGAEREIHVLSPSSWPVDPWPLIDAAAYHGLAGDMVRTIEPHTEADPVALLLQFLAAAGNVIGRSPHWKVEGDHHRGNLFVCLVGATAKARKGTSLGRVRDVVKVADERWSADRAKGGLSSGEGLINLVRDPIEKWNAKAEEFETSDPGVADKRLLLTEPEFAAVLTVAERQGNTLTELIRRAWDGDKLESLTKNSPLCATDAHISIIAHITEDELRARLTRTDAANGFGSLPVCSGSKIKGIAVRRANNRQRNSATWRTPRGHHREGQDHRPGWHDGQGA